MFLHCNRRTLYETYESPRMCIIVSFLYSSRVLKAEDIYDTCIYIYIYIQLYIYRSRNYIHIPVLQTSLLQTKKRNHFSSDD